MYGQFPAQKGGYSELITANSVTAGGQWRVWQKPRGIARFNFLAVGCGGGGGTGVIGANSVAAGGGGGGSGGQVSFTIDAYLLPDILYFSLAFGSTAAGVASRIAIYPDTQNNHTLVLLNGGGVGGNAAAGTAGAAGAGGVVTAPGGSAPLAILGAFFNFLVGQAGIIGGAAISGATLTIPITGLIVTGGTGGGGLPAAAAAGTNGGNFTVPAGPKFPSHAGGVGPVVGSPTVPPTNGSNGYGNFNGLLFFYGGTGGGSTHGTATGAGLVQARGGNGAPGCGGGGMGGALTGATPAVQAKGGDAFCLITGH